MYISKLKAQLEAFKEKSIKEQLVILFPYVMVSFVMARIAELWRLCNGNLAMFMKNIAYVYKIFPPRFTLTDLLIGVSIGIVIIQAMKWNNKMHSKNERHREEYGSSRWGNKDDIKPFIDENPFNNIILSQTECLSMKPRMSKFNLNRNKHVAVYGGTGSGKTYGFVKPNLYQLHSSYVLTDPNG